ncbi:MAG: carbohydrate ABC transporter permease [Thermotogaceae bacterium]|nr:carbohydrate ABC transporter permease [Thermotogaceae bacterium]
MRRKLKISFIISYLILIVYAVVSLFPFIWAFLVSTTPLNGIDPATGEKFGVDIMQWPPNINLFRIPPKVFGVNATLENYKKIFEVVPYYSRWFLNTVIYALALTIGNVILDTLGGYAFARLKFPLRNFWFILFLSTMMVPFQVTMIPQYNLMVKLGLVNTYPGLIIPKLTSVFGLFLMRQFFLNFPKELEEAAIIDGAGIFKTFFRIALPNARPAVTALSIYTFLGAWNDFIWPLIITSSKEMYTLTMGLNFFKTSYYTFWQYMMAATILMTIPMIIIFLSFQNQFVETGRFSSLKG